MHDTQTIGQAFLANIEDGRKWREELVEIIHENGWQSLRENGIFQASMEVSGEAQDRLEHKLQQKLLQRLRFADIQDRHDQIAEAHKETFQWIFQDPAVTGKPWSNFESWLKTGQSLYWITGKPASGKSTLMKFVYNDPRTMDMLRSWAGTHELFTAAFFFSAPGSRMQKSQIGLVRSLLYQILQEDTTLIPFVFPDRWAVSKLFREDHYEWKWTELVQALKTILSGHTSADMHTNSRKNYCFFIDGLDEFDGDPTDLLDLILELESFPNVKLCISSRPRMIFKETLYRKPSLLLEDLTYLDILRYVYSSFHRSRAFLELQAQDSEYANAILEQICQKACGVFLWVRLTVASLTQGLLNGDRASDLRGRLDSIPPDLETFFQKMLDGLDYLYRAQASQLFQIVRVAETPLTLLQLSYADMEDPEAVFRAETAPLDSAVVVSRCKVMRRRIISRCCGLLEIAGTTRSRLDSIDPTALLTKNAENDANVDSHTVSLITSMENLEPQPVESKIADSCAKLRVEYIHRTAKDFVESTGVWHMILQQSVQSFDPYSSLARGNLLELKTFRVDPLAPSNISMRTVGRCFRYAQHIEGKSHAEEFRLLDEAIRVASEPAKSADRRLSNYSRLYEVNQLSDGVSIAVLHLMALEGMTGYINYRIAQNSLERGSQLWLMILSLRSIAGLLGPSTALIHRINFGLTPSSSVRPEVQTLQVLIENGISPSESFPTTILKSCYPHRPPRATPWLVFLSSLFRPNSDFVPFEGWKEVLVLFIQSEAIGKAGRLCFSVDQWAKSHPEHADLEDRMTDILRRSPKRVIQQLEKAGITIQLPVSHQNFTKGPNLRNVSDLAGEHNPQSARSDQQQQHFMAGSQPKRPQSNLVGFGRNSRKALRKLFVRQSKPSLSHV